MNTKPIYLEDTYLFEYTTKITDIVQQGNSADVYFEETIFYPQGGGQPSDVGYIIINQTKYDVTFVEKYSSGDIVHHVSNINVDDNMIGAEVELYVNKEARVANAKSHTAGHLITHILEHINEKFIPIKGHHFPNESYIEVIDEERVGNGDLMDVINKEIDLLISKSTDAYMSNVPFGEVEEKRPLLSKYIPKDNFVRVLNIGDYTFLPCGGTHVKNLSELQGLRVTRVKRKKDRTKVNYNFN